MPYKIPSFSLTIPAGTPKAAPVTFNTPVGNFILSGVEFVVPDGANGNVGFRLATGGQQVIPDNAGAWLIASGEKIEWPLSGQLTTGAWQVIAYNTGLNDHTIQVRYLLDLIVNPAPLPPANLLSAAAIAGGPAGVIAGTAPDAP